LKSELTPVDLDEEFEEYVDRATSGRSHALRNSPVTGHWQLVEPYRRL
jgi:hypothetical protein